MNSLARERMQEKAEQVGVADPCCPAVTALCPGQTRENEHETKTRNSAGLQTT